MRESPSAVCDGGHTARIRAAPRRANSAIDVVGSAALVFGRRQDAVELGDRGAGAERDDSGRPPFGAEDRKPALEVERPLHLGRKPLARGLGREDTRTPAGVRGTARNGRCRSGIPAPNRACGNMLPPYRRR